ncbi:MAG: YvcK family protein [Peptococcaceae bacterium]|nr:YvcK family protein [Peptococcaceae bacterium]
MQSGPRIVVIGGGTGLSVLLRGLKHYTSNITAIVTVADDGGSSGRLRGDMGILPPGDIRNCVLALADTEPLLEKLFQYRFSVGELEGHSFGNLLIAAMTSITGDFQLAIKEFSKVLAVRGRVLPVTASDIRLVAELYDGSTVLGESKVSECGCNIKSLRLEPPNAEPLPEVLQAIAEADALVLGPGSLFTSVIPNLLVSGMSQAIARSVATKIYICNVMTQPGETTQFTASQHVDAIQRLANARIIDFVLVNTARIKADLLSKYSAQNSAPVLVDMHRLNQLGVRVVADDLLHQCSVVRHDPEKLARRVMRLIINNTISTERRRRQRKQKRN